MQTNMSFPTYVFATVSPGLLHDRMPAFCEPLKEAHQLKLTRRPIPRTTDHRPGFDN